MATVDEALEGARHIVAEWISEDADLRKALRQLVFDEGVVVSRKVTDAVDEQEKFKMYYEYREPVKTIPSHRMLAIRRGEAENVLYFLIDVEPERAIGILRRNVLRQPGDWTPQLELAIDDAWKRLLNSSIQGEIRLGAEAPLRHRSYSRSSATISITFCSRRLPAPSPCWASIRACAPAAKSPWWTRPESCWPTTCSTCITSKHGNDDRAKLEKLARAAQRARHRHRQRHRLARD